MTVLVSTLLIGVTVFSLLWHCVVMRRLRALETGLPTAYQLAIAAPTQDDGPPRLIALAIDLTRKQHCTLPFDDLTTQERRLALHAYGIDALPSWMSHYAALMLRPADRAMIAKLRQVRSSRPERREVHFGAIRQQQQLRAAQKG